MVVLAMRDAFDRSVAQILREVFSTLPWERAARPCSSLHWEWGSSIEDKHY